MSICFLLISSFAVLFILPLHLLHMNEEEEESDDKFPTTTFHLAKQVQAGVASPHMCAQLN